MLITIVLLIVIIVGLIVHEKMKEQNVKIEKYEIEIDKEEHDKKT